MTHDTCTNAHIHTHVRMHTNTHTHTHTHTHTQSESEALQQSGARTQSVVQSLRQQLTEAEEKRREDSSLTDLQTQLGRLRSELSDKVGTAS